MEPKEYQKKTLDRVRIHLDSLAEYKGFCNDLGKKVDWKELNSFLSE